jgi:multiple sugar transport system ATP-binding protein
VLGIRPEHLRAGGDRRALRAVVRLVENLGSEEVAHCTVGDARVCVRGPRPLGLTSGDVVSLSTTPERVHLFHRATGRRLQWAPETALAPEPESHELDLSAL